MKKILISLLAVILTTGLFAAQRTAEEAAAIAKQVNYSNLPMVIKKGTPALVPQRQDHSVRLAYTQLQPKSDKAAFYVFNRDQQGFVIVSADDNTRDVLAYSDEGTFSDQVPDNVQFLLDYMAERIAYSGKMGKTAAATTSYTPVAPLLDGIQWDQDEPYWNMCPIDKNGDRAYTGCVATATAQVMRYWKWPTKGTGSHSYTAENVSGTLSANFGATTYDWANMPKTTSGYTTTAQKNAVATLMYHVGVAIDMNYGGETIGGSGAYTNDVATALVDYFGYKNTIQYVYTYANGESASTTAQRMRAELAQGRPVIVGGSDEEGSSGHEFVFEGYDKDGLFYVNWGWGGSCNGYYAIDDLEPGGSGIGGNGAGYSHYLDYIIGIEPNGSVTPPTPSTPKAISGLQYGDAVYRANDGSPLWCVDSYKGYNDGYIYPELYFIFNAKSKTSLSGTYNLLYVEYTASKGNVVEGYNGRITISFTKDGKYHFEGSFYGDDGNAYTFDQTITLTRAIDYDNDYAEITLVEPTDHPIVKRDTIDVISNKMTYSEFIASDAAVQYYAGNDAGYTQLCVTSKNASSVFGTFDVWADYSWINFTETTSTDIKEGKITVTEEQTGVRLTGYVIGNDEKYYRLNWFMAAGILPSDTDAPFDATFNYSDMSATIKNGVIGIYATNAENFTIGLELYTNPTATKIPVGTYVISDSGEPGTALKSIGVVNNHLVECWAGIRGTNGITNCWFIVEGTVTLSYDEYDKLKVVVNGKNSWGQPITTHFISLNPAIPTVQDLATAGYDVTNSRVICIHPDEEVCNPIVWAGTYNNWNTDPSQILKFEALAGFDGWYVVEVDDARLPQDDQTTAPNNNCCCGKPVQLKLDGSFSWDFQSGDYEAWINKKQPGTQTHYIYGGYDGEADICWNEYGAYIYELAYWKKHNTPCVAVPKHDYSISLYAPKFCEAIANYADSVRIMGGFDNWTMGKLMEKRVDANNQIYYYTTLPNTEENTEFKFRCGSMSWDFQILYNGYYLADEKTGTGTNIVYYYNGKGYNWTFCPEPVYLTVNSNDYSHSITMGSGTYDKDAEVLIMAANTDEGYVFDQWNDGNKAAARYVTVSEDVVYTAFFVPKSSETCIEVASNDETLGIAVVAVMALPINGGTFLNWDDGNTNNPRVINELDGTLYTAIFTTGTPTEVQKVEGKDDQAVRKIIKDDRLYIIRNGIEYIATGARTK